MTTQTNSQMTTPSVFTFKKKKNLRSAQQRYLWFAAIHVAGLALALLAITR